jgi:hypothetical protein
MLCICIKMQISSNMIILGLVIFIVGYFLNEQNKYQQPAEQKVEQKVEPIHTPSENRVVVYRDIPSYYNYPYGSGYYGGRGYYPRRRYRHARRHW